VAKVRVKVEMWYEWDAPSLALAHEIVPSLDDILAGDTRIVSVEALGDPYSEFVRLGTVLQNKDWCEERRKVAELYEEADDV